MNHTSSDHPWFQESRSSPDTPKRDWYVWSDTPERYQDARIIFIDTESSNWTWDRVAGAVLLAPLLLHQPDLNYDNPEVQEAMLDVLRFWLDIGLDGFRLDAVPYLFEREGTICENLPETHALPQASPRDDRRATTRTACCSPRPTSGPRTSSSTSAHGDECQMAFHFPVMPRMFMARAPRAGGADLRDPRAARRRSRQLPVGAVPAQPRRADARDGHRRGARLHVRRVRAGSADEAQPRDPPPARAAARQRPRRDRADDGDPVLAARLARSSTTATRSRWATTSSSATATACARRCSGPATATAASRAPTSPSSTRRR